MDGDVRCILAGIANYLVEFYLEMWDSIFYKEKIPHEIIRQIE